MDVMGKKILVIDDEESICKLIEKVLIDKGYRVKYICRGKDAIELLKKEKFDVIFQDFMMPGIHGVELLSEIKSISPVSKAILISGFNMNKKTMKDLKVKGLAGFLRKPFELKQLYLAVA